MRLKLRSEYCCLLAALVIGTGCRTGGGGKESIPPTQPEKECQPGTIDAASEFKEALLQRGQWAQDGQRWKAESAALAIFKSVQLAQEKPELLKTPGSTLEDKWSVFYDDAIQVKDSFLTLAPAGVSNACLQQP
jgi:hypothetical protein